MLFGQNRALHFNGSDEYVSLSSVMNMGETDFTLECRFRADKFPETEDGCLINKGFCRFGIPSRAGYRLQIQRSNGRNQIIFIIAGANDEVQEVGNGLTNLSTGTWYHVAAVRKQSTLLLYINGNCIAKTDFGKILNVDTNIPLALGACARPPVHAEVSNYFKGTLDEVRFWKVARTQNAIIAQMDSQFSGKEPDLLAYYDFEAGSRPVPSAKERHLYDKSPRCFHGQLIGFRMRNGRNSGWITAD